jgi:hypothetical protein
LTYRSFAKQSSIIAVIVILFASIFLRGGIVGVAVGIALGYLVIFWCGSFLFFYIRSLDRNLVQAFATIPSPAEIEAQLRAEGLDPTLQDVLLTHQYLTSQRNEAAVITGAMLVAIHHAAKVSKGK